MLWGLLTGFVLFAVDWVDHVGYRKIQLLREGATWFNPLGWAFGLAEVPAARSVFLGGMVALWVSAGWLLRLGVRPRDPAAAFAAAAATGLVAAWVCTLFFAPLLAVENGAQLYHLRCEEPPTWRLSPDGRVRLGLPDIDMEHFDLQTLEQYIPPEKRDRTRLESAPEYSRVHEDLIAANRYYRTTVGVWASQFGSLVFLLTAARASGLAADHVARSGRDVAQQLRCYLEMYVQVLLALAAGAILTTIAVIASEPEKHANPPPVWPFAVALVATVAASVVAWTGVMRRWHPAVRLGTYVALAAVVAGCFWTVWR